MISAEVEGRLPYMTYPDPWRGPPKQQPEFLRPQPKPLLINKYNGLSTSQTALNGARLLHSQRQTTTKYSPPASSPVNLTQHQQLKEDMTAAEEQLAYNYTRNSTYQHANNFANYAHPQYLYPNHHYQMFRSAYVPPQTIQQLEQYSPNATAAAAAASLPVASTNTGTFLSPTNAYSPPAAKAQPLTRNERRQQPPPPPVAAQQPQAVNSPTGHQNFKMPSGKEGSLKHRILQTRPEDNVQRCAIDLHKSPTNTTAAAAANQQQETQRRRLSAAMGSPPQSPANKTIFNNNTMLIRFTKGCLIQLENGDLKTLEDMKTEDFVHSAEISPELRLAESTVVKIEENPITGTVTIALTYNQRRTQVEVEYPLEHPFFVYGKGWASCSPDRTLHMFDLKVYRLQVGDVIVSLTPRKGVSQKHPSAAAMTTNQPSKIGATYTTTATTTAMTVRQVSTAKPPTNHSISHLTGKSNNVANHAVAAATSPESMSKKRRWSAPGQIGDEDEEGNPQKLIKIDQ